MWTLLKKLIAKWACMHEWDVYNRKETFLINKDGQQIGDMPIEHTHTLICKECGKIKKINT